MDEGGAEFGHTHTHADTSIRFPECCISYISLLIEDVLLYVPESKVTFIGIIAIGYCTQSNSFMRLGNPPSVQSS